MTTEVMIINFGPNPVEISVPQSTANTQQDVILFSRQITRKYVYTNNDILIKEKRNSE